MQMEIGIDSFAALQAKPGTRQVMSAADRLDNLIEEIVTADKAGVDVFGLGEHHRSDFLDSAPAIILAAASRLTQTIKLTSAVTVLSAADPVRVFQEFATIDLLTKGRIEMIVGRGSFIESYPLFGLRLEDYDALFTEKLELLLKLNEDPNPRWKGRFRAELTGQGVYPRPYKKRLPVWLGVGGTPESFQRAGRLGLPLMVAIIGGSPRNFSRLVELYRESGRQAGFRESQLKVGVHAFGYCAATDQQAADEFYPGYAESMNKVGQERGWAPMTRRSFESLLGPEGALVLGDPDTVSRKIRMYDDVLGGLSRFTFQMSPAAVQHEQLLTATRLIGREVKARVNGNVQELIG